MAEISRDEMHRLARLGAQARLEEIRREESIIRRAFPELFRGAGRPARGTSSSFGAAEGAAAGARQRPVMSAAMRKAVSIRMKKYWAERRKAKAAASKGK